MCGAVQRRLAGCQELVAVDPIGGGLSDFKDHLATEDARACLAQEMIFGKLVPSRGVVIGLLDLHAQGVDGTVDGG